MTFNVRRVAGTPLTDEERQQLRALAQMPDSEIDFSDIPERTYDHSSESALPLEGHTVKLQIDSEVAAWLEAAGPDDAIRINYLLKRAAQKSKHVSSTDTMLDKAS